MKKWIIILLLPFMSSSSFLTNNSSSLPARTGKDYAVFFYVTRFQPGWLPLPDTEPESQNLAEVLEKDYGFEKPKTVANPTRQQILDEIAAWNTRLGPDDQVLFFFSMHGYYDPNSELGYLIASDGLYRDEYFSTWLDYNSLHPYFARCKAKHILVALDACYSGSFGKIEKAPDHPAYDESQNCQAQVDAAFQYQVRQYICAGSKDAKTPGKSLFADKLLETLRRGNADSDGILHFDDITYALGKVREPVPVHGSFSGHAPGGDFIFIRKNACFKNIQSQDDDGDGVLNTDDKCPHEFGLKVFAGCPKKLDTDASTDSDYDGIPDNRDGCPLEYGTAKANGCPDRDNDGVPDKSDKCPGKAGEPYWQGCPDTDGDGLPDHEDQCPNEKGLVADKGCPPVDSDGDGVPDKSDKCPTVAGLAYLQGCPDPDDDKKPDDGLVLVTGGRFTMGSPANEKDRSDDETQHEVVLSDFYIGKYEVTRQQWRDVMGSDPAELRFKGCDACPVERVSWEDIQGFLTKLNANLPKGQKPYRLPSEAEWEYAARGGQKSKGGLYAGGNSIDILAWYTSNAESKTHPVGTKAANELGIFDMAGNVCEWCSDWYGTYPTSTVTNPTGPTTGSDRVMRGGSWYTHPQYCRVADRFSFSPGYRLNFLGFRLARTK